MSALKKVLEQMPAGSLVPRDWVLSELTDEVPVRWRSLCDAASIMGEPEKRVRVWCARWANMPDPPIRVRKAGGRPKSPWELDEAGCFRWRESKGVRPVVTGGVTVDSGEALLDHWGRLATEGMECPEEKKSSGAIRLEKRASTV